MSLLDKKKGLAMLPALFLLFFACEEPSELGVGLNPKENEISTHYLEIPVETAQLRIDTIVSSTIITDVDTRTGLPAFRSVLIGRANDPTFGTLTATAFTNIGTPLELPETVSQDAGVDSLVLRLNYNTSYIGSDISAPQTLQVYSLEEAIEPTSGSAETKGRYNYTISSSEPLGAELEEISFDTASTRNRLIIRKLSSDSSLALANKILNILKTDTDSTILRNQQAFNTEVGGLAIVPGENNTFITNYFLSGGSQIELYYGGNTKPVVLPFVPELGEGQVRAIGDYLPTYHNLEADYTGTPFENAPAGNNVEFQNPDNQVYYRAGVGLLPKINFSGLEDFVISNAAGEIVINQAVLIVDSVYKSNSRETFPEQANFFFVEEENNRPFSGVTEPYAGASLALKTSAVNSESERVYSYTADVTEEIERFVQTRDSRFLQGIIAPGSSPTSLLNIIAKPEHMVLKVVYTVLKNQNEQDN